MAGEDEDPWGFVADRRPRRPDRPADQAAPGSVRADRARGELREVALGPSLKRRAWPLGLTLALVLLAGFVTEMVGASQMLALAGPTSLLVMYPLGGLGLLLLALLAFRHVDRRARLPMLRGVLLGYGMVFAGAVPLMVAGVVPVLATGVAWLLADQLMFLIPLLVWSLAADEFNVAEARRIFGWIVSWTYAGQVVGLAVATIAPAPLAAVGLPLPVLLVVDPLICLFLALWVPRVMAGTAAGRGLVRDETLGRSMGSAWSFVRGVPVWRTLLVASVLIYAAGMTGHLSFMAGAEILVGSDPATLQTLLAGVSLAAFCLCWLVQVTVAERIQERLGIPGTLMVLPIAAVLAGVLLAVGAAVGSVAVMAVGISAFRIPKWSLDENARRAAFALVPDERRARVSFLVDLLPLSAGLMLSAAVASLVLIGDRLWVAPAVAAVIALASVPPMLRVRRGWDDSLINWRLRRRKQNRTLDLG